MGSICGHTAELNIESSSSSSSSHSLNFSDFYSLSERVLSKNGSCEIRLCRSKTSQSVHVAKIVEGGSASAVEALILKRLRHPHILNLFDFFKEHGKNYLVLEYLQHGDLSTFLNKTSKVPEKTTCRIMRQVLSALAYCHDQGVVHRDIKPENVLIDSIGKNGVVCKLADFDSAGLLDKSGKGVYGTLYYTAPEVFAGNYDEKVDIWSSGVMLYQLLTGKHLFSGSNSEEIRDKIYSEDIVLDNSISCEARDLLEKMLNRDSSLRIGAKEACKHSWFSTNFTEQNVEVLEEFSDDITDGVLEDFIVNRVYDRKEMKKFQAIFEDLDRSFEGKVRVSELIHLNDMNSKSEFWDFRAFLRASVAKHLKSNQEILKRFADEIRLSNPGYLLSQEYQNIMARPSKLTHVNKSN